MLRGTLPASLSHRPPLLSANQPSSGTSHLKHCSHTADQPIAGQGEAALFFSLPKGHTTMNNLLRPLTLSGVLLFLGLPLCAPSTAAGDALPRTVQKALKHHKLESHALSLAAIPLNGPGQATTYNADVSVNPASTMKLVTTYAALELLGPAHQWQTEFYADGPIREGVLNGNLYLKGGGDPKLNMEKLWLLLRDLRAHGV